jgi:hypothetical protein
MRRIKMTENATSETETTKFVLPKGIDQELYDSAKEIIISG